MKRLVVIGLTVANSLFSFGQTTINTAINKPATWTKSNSPYIITDDVEVNAHLVIEHGVEVRFNASKSLYINEGGIEVNGVAGDSVVFTSSDINDHSAGFWYQIRINDSVAKCVFSYVKIENAQYGISGDDCDLEVRNSRVRNCYSDGVVVAGNFAKLAVDSCLFQDNYYGLDCYNSSYNNSHTLVVTNSTFSGNKIGLFSNMDADISSNHFYNNEVSLYAYAVYSSPTISITKNTFESDSIGIKFKKNYPAPITAHCNSFSCRYFNLYFAGYIEDTIDVTNNYFGSTDSAGIQDKIYDKNDDGYVYGSFTFVPYLTSLDTLSISVDKNNMQPCMGKDFSITASSNMANATFLWYKNGVSLKNNTAYTGAETPTLGVASADASHDGTYTCVATTDCQSATSLPAAVSVVQPYTLDSLCLATVSDNGKNALLVWERTSGKGTTSYNIYREGLTDIYTKIGEVPYSQKGIFVDSTADVSTRAYRYKITATNTCGDTSSLVKAASHRTIHLQTVLENNVLHLNWTPYVGAKVKGYALLSGPSNDNLKTTDEMGADQVSYVISDPGTMIYRIVALIEREIFPGTEKSDSGPYSQSLSNLAESEILEATSITGTGIELALFPNPAKGTLTCFTRTSSPSTLYITGITGSVILEKTLTPGNSDEKISLSPGIYTIKIISNGSTKYKQVIIY